MDQASIAKAKRTLDVVEELSGLLNTGLNRNELSILLALIENGCNPEVRLPILMVCKPKTSWPKELTQ